MPSRRGWLRPALFASLLALPAATADATPIHFHVGTPANPGTALGFFFEAVGDVDGDHRPDVIGLQSTNGVVVWLKNNAGVVGPAQTITMPFPVTTFAAGDLDGDGRADLVVCDSTAANGALAILHSNGADFDPATLVPTDAAGIMSVTLADLDGDGDLDIVASNQRTHRVDRLFNDGAGHFSGLTSTTIPLEVSRTWVLDLNGDGRADILTGNWPQLLPSFPYHPWSKAASADFTMLGTGGGNFAAPVPANVVAIVALGAFSGAGAHDALVADSVGFGIAHGLGDGTFSQPVYAPDAWKFCSEPFATAIDLDGDGHDEILGGTGNGCTPSTFGVLRVDASLAVVHREEYSGLVGIAPCAADMDGDGRQDAVCASPFVALNQDGRLGGARLLSRFEPHSGGTNAAWSDIQDVDASDLNKDGATDIVISTRSGPGAIFISRHDGSFDPAFPWQGNSYIRESAIADLNGDGFPDVAEVHRDPGLQCDFYAWLNDGAGHTGATTQVHLTTTALSQAVPCDFDGDGDVDVLSVDGHLPGTVLFFNDGSGHFTTGPSSLPISGTYAAISGETLPARFSVAGDSLQVEHGSAVGVLAPPVRTEVPTLLAARFADVNGDGRIDAACLLSGNQVETFLGQPGGTWSAPIVSPIAPVATGYTPTFAGVGDLDGDGRPDLLFTGTGTGLPVVIAVLRNLGGGLFGDRGDNYPTQSFGTLIADVDGDGAGDLIGVQPPRVPTDPAVAVNLLMGWKNADQPTPALVSLVSANAAFDRASLAWFVPADGPASLTLERRREDGAWSALSTVTPVAGRITFDDRGVEAGATYAWRLVWQEGGATRFSDVATLAIPERPRFAITGVWPNPADADRVTVSLTVDHVAPLEVKLVDVAGRIVASRHVAPGAAGRVDVVLDGLAGLRPSLYFAHVEQGGRRATATVVRVR